MSECLSPDGVIYQLVNGIKAYCLSTLDILLSGNRRTSQTTSLDEIQESEEEKGSSLEISSETGAG